MTASSELGGCDGRLFLGVHHVAMAVSDLDAAVAWYTEVLGASVECREVSARDGVEEVMLVVGASRLQLISPTDGSSHVARFLTRRGQGLHHVAYEVSDCAAALASVLAAGGEVVDAEPRPGSGGTKVAFVHPRSAFGTLIELVQG